jgi:hypothetical protein
LQHVPKQLAQAFMVVVVVVVAVVVVVGVTQCPWPSQSCSLVQVEMHVPTSIPVKHVRHWFASQLPQLSVPPQPSPVETGPQVPGRHDVTGVQQAPLKSRCPCWQQSPNSAVAFFEMAFAQFLLQQLMLVAQTALSGLQPPARASVLTRSTVLATSASRAMRQSDFASDMPIRTSGRG